MISANTELGMKVFRSLQNIDNTRMAAAHDQRGLTLLNDQILLMGKVIPSILGIQLVIGTGTAFARLWDYEQT